MKVIRSILFIFLINFSSFSVVHPGTKKPAERRESINYILDEVTTFNSNGKPTTTYEMPSLTQAGLTFLGLGLVCGYYYGLYKGCQFAYDKTSVVFSSLSDFVKKNYHKAINSDLVNRFNQFR